MNKLNMKQPKDVMDECWGEFEFYLNECACDEALKVPPRVLWEIWYAGYSSNYPMERNVGPAMLVKMKKGGK
jgi:hypothetical protein